ncbi:MAG: hypothetical protein EP297_03135 [Gammaproteobacteria bacterium]|nr:MAG: hypothetical protein EP297_03135 [Gammaproteobacteria bacterium]
MYNMAKKLALVTAVVFGVAVIPSVMAHQYKHGRHHDTYAGKHYKRHHYKGGHSHKYRNHHRHHGGYGYRYRPYNYIGLGYYDGPYGYDGLDLILKYHFYD